VGLSVNRSVLVVAVSMMVVGAATPSYAATGPTTVLVGTTPTGEPLLVGGVSMSADGRFVVTNDFPAPHHPPGVYLRDLLLGRLTLVSVSSSGEVANGFSAGGVLSADNRFVVFDSYATNLAGVDTNDGMDDIYLRNLALGRTVRVSLSSKGAQATEGVFAEDVSAHGRFVTFSTAAGNLVPGDTNQATDVFLRDRRKGTLRRVSVTNDGRQASVGADGGAISDSGRYVVFTSTAALVAGDTNGVRDVYIRDVRSHTTSLVSVSDSGTPGNNHSSLRVAISGDGRYVAFISLASNLVVGDTNELPDVFLRDRLAGTTRRANISTTGAQEKDPEFGSHYAVSVSNDGRYVAFDSEGSMLVPGDTNRRYDVFEHDFTTGATRRISVTDTGGQADADSIEPVVSADGRCVLFNSQATNLITGTSMPVSSAYLRITSGTCP
jgi:Tol biopolymer transport system component